MAWEELTEKITMKTLEVEEWALPGSRVFCAQVTAEQGLGKEGAWLVPRRAEGRVTKAARTSSKGLINESKERNSGLTWEGNDHVKGLVFCPQ